MSYVRLEDGYDGVRVFFRDADLQRQVDRDAEPSGRAQDQVRDHVRPRLRQRRRSRLHRWRPEGLRHVLGELLPLRRAARPDGDRPSDVAPERRSGRPAAARRPPSHRGLPVRRRDLELIQEQRARRLLAARRSAGSCRRQRYERHEWSGPGATGPVGGSATTAAAAGINGAKVKMGATKRTLHVQSTKGMKLVECPCVAARQAPARSRSVDQGRSPWQGRRQLQRVHRREVQDQERQGPHCP